MTKPRAGSTYIFNPCGWDIIDRKSYMPEPGTKVKVIKAPYGCPKNGTMNHCYIGDLSGNFIGLVCCGSLDSVK